MIEAVLFSLAAAAQQTTNADDVPPTYRCVGMNSKQEIETILFRLEQDSLSMRFGDESIAGPLDSAAWSVMDKPDGARVLLIDTGDLQFRLEIFGLGSEQVAARMMGTADSQERSALFSADCEVADSSETLTSTPIDGEKVGAVDQSRGWFSLKRSISFECSIYSSEGEVSNGWLTLGPDANNPAGDKASIRFGDRTYDGATVAGASRVQDGQVNISSFLNFGEGDESFAGSVTGTGETLLISLLQKNKIAVDEVPYGKGTCALNEEAQ